MESNGTARAPCWHAGYYSVRHPDHASEPPMPTLQILTILTMMVTTSDDPIKPGDYSRTVESGGRKRTYLVHIPPKYDRQKPMPLVLAFHGGGSNAPQMVRFCGLNEKGDAAGFIVVYPNGTGRIDQIFTWNTGNCCGYALSQNVDDVAFVRALLDDLGRDVAIDPKRVYATGMSNGGMMAYRLGAELSDRIAAIAPVGGPMGTETCAPQRPVPVIHFHGTADEFAPFAGGRGARSLSQTNFFSVDHSIQAWVKANGCTVEPVITKLANKVDDGTSIIRKTYPSGKDGAEVVLIEIQGAGHTWPGRNPPLAILGKSTKNVSANDVLWEFFEKHPRKL